MDALGHIDDETGVLKAPDDNELPAGLAEISVSLPEELSEDEICIAIKEDEVPDTVLKAVLWGLAEEQSSLKKLRQTRQGAGKDTSYISMKRGTLLKYMSETLLQRQALVGITSDIDLKGPKFREIFKMLLGIISDTFEEVKIPLEYKEMFFQALSNNLEGWEVRAERVLKTMSPKVR